MEISEQGGQNIYPCFSDFVIKHNVWISSCNDSIGFQLNSYGQNIKFVSNKYNLGQTVIANNKAKFRSTLSNFMSICPVVME